MQNPPGSSPTPSILGRLRLPALLGLAIVALVAALSAAPSPAEDPPVPAPPGGAAPVAVVELFTSQGCSSCPPADRLLSRLGADPALRGRVVPLAFHVDYWNYIGWQDPFSSPKWSERQRLYARAYGSSRIYTPQLVVNGTKEMVGSEERQVRGEIERALAAKPAGAVALAVAPQPGGGALRVKVEASHGKRLPHDLEVWVALFQNGLTTPVGSGENARRTLKNDSVVRRLEKAFVLPAEAGASRAGEVTLELAQGWPRPDLGVAAFLQDPVSREIHGGAVRYLR